MWGLTPAVLDQHPHIEAVIASCRALHAEGATWQTLRTAVTALDDRTPRTLRITRRRQFGRRLRHRAAAGRRDARHLPRRHRLGERRARPHRAQRSADAGGRHQDRFRPARLLRAALAAHQHHRLHRTSWAIPQTGPLSDKQQEYLGYITASSNALLAIIDNILDLASIGAGAMQLELEPVDIRATMHAAAEGVQDRLVKNNIRLDIKAPPDIGSLRRRRAAHSPNPLQPARECGRLLTAGRDRDAHRAARRRSP